MVSAIQIINALSSGKSLVVFDLIAVEGGDKKSIINSLGLSPKQYNSAISALRKSGLVEKIHGKYGLTSFGEVIHEGRQLIESGIKDYWQLKAIDAIWTELPQKERSETIEILIDNQRSEDYYLGASVPARKINSMATKTTSTSAVRKNVGTLSLEAP